MLENIRVFIDLSPNSEVWQVSSSTKPSKSQISYTKVCRLMIHVAFDVEFWFMHVNRSSYPKPSENAGWTWMVFGYGLDQVSATKPVGWNVFHPSILFTRSVYVHDMNFIVYQGQKKDIEKDTFPIENPPNINHQPPASSAAKTPTTRVTRQVSDLPPLPTRRPPCVAVQYVALTTVHLEDRDVLNPTIDGWWRARTFLCVMTR